MNWYFYFVASVLLLWGFSSPRDRNALRIILLATLASLLITEGVTRQITGSWKLVVPATVEALTIIALLRFSKNLTGYLQAGLLGIAWATHVLCYIDLRAGTNLVYDDYERILGVLAMGQILACHDTFAHIASRVVALVESLRRHSVRGVSAASLSSDLLRDTRPKGVSEAK